MGLDDEETDLFKFLVEVHIHMSELTSKRDISDPDLLKDFANLVGTENRLKLLYVFTVIDTKSVGPNVLTNWKKAILYTLYKNTLEVLKNSDNSLLASQTNKEQELLKNYLLQKEKLEEGVANQVLLFAAEMLPHTYLRYNTPRRVVQQFLMHLQCKSNPSEIPEIEFEKEPAYVTVTVYSLEDRYLLSDLTGTVTSEALSVIGMRSFKNTNGFVISQISITDSFGGGNIKQERLDRLKGNIKSVILKKVNVENYGDIEKKIQTWSLEEIEAYATANNPLYLAEKQNIGMARGDLITAALYRNPVVAYQQQFIPMNIRETGTNYGPTAGTSGGGFQVFQQQVPGGAGGLQEIAPSVSWETDFGIIRNQKIKVASQGFQAQIAQFADFDRLFRLRLRQNYWLHLYITELIDFQKEFYENYNDLL